jgi:putative endopeptidase
MQSTAMAARAHTALFSLLILSFACSTLLAAEVAPLKSGIDRANFDTSIKPGDNFFDYVNGTWIKDNPIPPEYSRWGAFPKLRDDNLTNLRLLVEELSARKTPLAADENKLRDFYATAMDETKREAQGVKPLGKCLDKIAKVRTTTDLIALVGEFRVQGAPALFSFSVDQDDKISTRYVVQLRQGGLGLPERDYYLGKSEYFQNIRQKYRAHVETMLTLSGDSPAIAKQAADTVLKIETQLAEASRTPTQLRDKEAQYNKRTVKELAELTPNLEWDVYWKTVGAKNVSEVIVGQPEFFERVNKLLKSVSFDDWRAYLRWKLVHATAPYLNNALEQENFNFYSETLRGVKQIQPRWKRAIGTLDRQMGEALGRLYVGKHFSPAAKQKMNELVRNLMVAYKERIETRKWMGDDTKNEALAKLGTFRTKIGYPDKWRDYSALQIGDDSYLENVMRSEAFDTNYRVARLHKPVDRDEWAMTPPTVNAYYNESLNEIVFPAGILQPPFFDPAADDAVNYGGIGAVIGHEITHGFDDQGSRSDAEGNLRNWWTAEDRTRFNALTDRLVKQYDDCVAVGDLHVNGKLTLGENIADLGGVTIAYEAYQKSLGDKPAKKIDGFTGAQRFFLGFAQVWRGTVRDADQQVLARTDPHSPSKFRGTVPLTNVNAFYEAFNLKPGDAMYRKPEDRVEVW